MPMEDEGRHKLMMELQEAKARYISQLSRLHLQCEALFYKHK